jgi:hypothetical protein
LHLYTDLIIKINVMSNIKYCAGVSYPSFISLMKLLVHRPQNWYNFGGHDTEPGFKLVQRCFDLFHIMAMAHFNIYYPLLVPYFIANTLEWFSFAKGNVSIISCKSFITVRLYVFVNHICPIIFSYYHILWLTEKVHC